MYSVSMSPGVSVVQCVDLCVSVGDGTLVDSGVFMRVTLCYGLLAFLYVTCSTRTW